MEKKTIMEDMKAMEYEYLIRKAFNCGRFGAPGANADIYRRYERNKGLYESETDAVKNNKPRKWNQPIEDLAYEAGRKEGEVVAHINNALDHVEKHYQDELTSEQEKELSDCKSELLEPSKEKIDKVIDRVHEVFSEAGLQMS
ncbi:hypothetical protein [Salibacter halophilus]|uniref:Uncharacterized protein n=1 Tax=Salibacter halophilus TaxID=1803916 RepID=A0A6N6M544_9FLAO|nr:hypothetical protein [Salibacter halophilus]KAB1061466.1 hypothetical protein F3059_13495 [Salibacter halophilus]